MIQKITYIAAILAVAATVSCSKEMRDPTAEAPDGKVFRTFRATTEITKGDIVGSALLWEVGDSIAVFDDVNPKDTNKFWITEIEGNVIGMEGSVSETATKFKAVYPYTAAVNNETGDSVKVTISGYQKIPAGKQIDPRYLVAVASSSGMDFTFRNVFSLVRFTITKEEISAVKMFVTKGNAIVRAGTAEQVKNPSFNPVEVKPLDSTYFTPGEYYVAVLPCTMEGIDVVCTEGLSSHIWKQDTNDTLKFKRNGGYDLGVIDNGRQLIAKWIFADAYKTANSKNFAVSKNTTVGFGVNADKKEAFVSSDFAGAGKIRYYQNTTAQCTRKLETSAAVLNSLSAGGACKGDYWDFSVKKQIPAGAKVHIWFKANTSSGPKQWQIKCSGDGTTWENGRIYNLPNTGESTIIDTTWTLSATLTGDDYVSLFRMEKITDNGGWSRILENKVGGFDWAPYIEIIEE